MTVRDVVLAALRDHDAQGRRLVTDPAALVEVFGVTVDDLARSVKVPCRMVRRALELHLEPVGLVERVGDRWRIPADGRGVAYAGRGAVVRPAEGGGDFPGG